MLITTWQFWLVVPPVAVLQIMTGPAISEKREKKHLLVSYTFCIWNIAHFVHFREAVKLWQVPKMLFLGSPLALNEIYTFSWISNRPTNQSTGLHWHYCKSSCEVSSGIDCTEIFVHKKNMELYLSWTWKKINYKWKYKITNIWE